MSDEQTPQTKFEINNKICTVYLWVLTQEEVIPYDKEESCPINGGYGYHGCDVHPSSAEYVLDLDSIDSGFETGDYLVATEHDDVPEVAEGWVVRPLINVDPGTFCMQSGTSVCVMDTGSGENEYVVAFHC